MHVVLVLSLADAGPATCVVQIRALSLTRVSEPRKVLKEFGLKLADDVEVRVWDSTAELRYMVLPERPPGTEKMNADELAALVTRDSIIDVTHIDPPKS